MTLTVEEFAEGLVDALELDADLKPAVVALFEQYSLDFASNAARTVDLTQQVQAGLLMNGPSALTRSSTTVDLGGAATNNVRITGAGTITSLGAGWDWRRAYFVTFVSGATLTDAAGLVLPGGASSVVFSAGSVALVAKTKAGTVYVSSWQGPAGVQGDPGPAAATAADASDGDDDSTIANTKFVQRAIGLKTRKRLAANATIYVSPTGDDDNDGLTVGTPKTTLQNAFNTAQLLWDQAGWAVTIALESGSYEAGGVALEVDGALGQTGAIAIRSRFGHEGGTYVKGDIVVGRIRVQNGAVLNLYEMDLDPGAEGASLIGYSNGSIAVFDNVRFKAAGVHVVAEHGGAISAPSGYDIIGSAVYHMSVAQHGRVSVGGPINIASGLAFSAQFASVYYNSLVNLATATFIGSSFTGKEYEVGWNGGLYNGNAIPGSIPGTTNNGGVAN